MSIIDQIKAFRLRWKPPENEDTDKILNRSFAAALSSPDGTVVRDYLIEKYLAPVEVLGSNGEMAQVLINERNGQQKMLMDILQRFDMGMHPMAFEPEGAHEEEKPFDSRM